MDRTPWCTETLRPKFPISMGGKQKPLGAGLDRDAIEEEVEQDREATLNEERGLTMALCMSSLVDRGKGEEKENLGHGTTFEAQ